MAIEVQPAEKDFEMHSEMYEYSSIPDVSVTCHIYLLYPTNE